MRLNKKHIGKLFDNQGDGSWVYLLVDITKSHLFFYSFTETDYVVASTEETDWIPFRPKTSFHTRAYQKWLFKELIEKRLGDK